MTMRRSRQAARPFNPADLLLEAVTERWRVFREELSRARRRPGEAAIHDLRVATRRLIAAIQAAEILVPESGLSDVRRTLRKHLRSFNSLRDVHVQMLHATGLQRRFPQVRRFASDLRVRERRLVRSASAEMRRIHVKPLERGITEALEEVLSLFARESAREAGRAALLGAGGAAFAAAVLRLRSVAPEDPRSLHRYRVAFKKLRYTIEILRPRLPWARKPLLRRMNAYQTVMGEIQDLEVLAASVKAFALRRGQAGSLPFVPVYHHLAEQRRLKTAAFLERAGEIFEFWQ
jgi:CHAD domain-containing protein